MARPPIINPDATAVEERPPIINPDIAEERAPTIPADSRPNIVDPDATPTTKTLPKGTNYLKFAEESSVTESTAKKYEDSIVNEMAFAIPPEETLRAKSGIDLALSHNPNAGVQKTTAKKVYDDVSSIGAHWQYQPKGVETTVKRLNRGEIISFARKFKEQGLINEEELKEVLLNPDPGNVFGRTVGPFTEENLPKPDDFYQKGWGERFGEILPSAAGGINYAIAGFFRGGQWLEGEAGVSLGAKGVADWLDENAEFAAKDVRQDFVTEIWGAAGAMTTLVAPGAVVGRAGKLLGLSERLALSLEIGSVTVGESLMEAGPSFNNVLQETGDISKANKAGRISFFSNLPVVAVGNNLGIYRSRIQALDKVTGRAIIKEGKAATIIGKVAEKGKAGIPEFGQEFAQEGIIAPVAEGRPVDIEAGLRAGTIGFGLGVVTSHLMSQAVEKIDEVGPMPLEVANIYDATVQKGLDSGLDNEQAHIEASREIAKTEAGQEYINKIGLAQEAVLKAEASMGEKQQIVPKEVEFPFTQPLKAIPTPLETAPEQAEFTPEGEKSAEEVLRQGEEATIAQTATETAEIVQDETINEPSERVIVTTPEEVQDLIDSELTDDQIVDELSREPEAIPQPEDVAIVEITPENVQEISARSSINPAVPAFENEQEVLKDETLAPELTSIEPLKAETFHQGQREYRTTPEVATEAIAEAFNDNPGQARGVVYRGMSIDQIENGLIPLEGVRDHKFNNDPSQSFKAVWTSSSYETAVERAMEYGDKGIIIAIPTSSLPENVYLQNASLTPGSIEDVWLGIPGDIKMNNVQIQPLTDALEGRKMELRRTEDDTIISEQRRREGRDIRGTEGTVPRPEEVEGVAGVSGVETGRPEQPSETGRVSPEDAAGGREGLLGEEGFIDLDSEVSLAPILTKLKTFTDNPSKALEDIKSLGRSIFNEGKTSLKEFTARMKHVLGELWTSFEGISRRAWDLINNERGSIQIGPDDKPIFPGKQLIGDARVEFEVGKELPAYMKNNPTWSEEEVKAALKKADNESTLTIRESEIVKASIVEEAAKFYEQVLITEGEFIDPVDVLKEGELDAIVEKGIEDVIATLKIETVKKPLTKAQKNAIERTKKIRKLTNEVETLTATLKDKADIIDNLHHNLMKKLAEAKAKGKETGKLEAKIAKQEEKIQKIRDKSKEAVKVIQRRESVKATIRRTTGQQFAEAEARERTSLRESLKAQVRAAREAQRAGKQEGVEKAIAKINEIQDRKKTKQRQSNLRKKVNKRLKKLKKSKKQDISVDYQKEINKLIETVDLKGKPTEKTRIALIVLRKYFNENQDKLEIPQERIDQIDRLGKLSVNEMTDSEVKELKDAINTLVQLGKLKRALKVKYDKQERQKEMDALLESTNNIDPKEFDPAEPTKLQNFNKGIRQAYMNTLHSPRVADMVDGLQRFDGPNAALIKDFARGESIAKLNTQTIVSGTIEQIIKETGIDEMSQEQQTNIMINIRIREGAFDQAKTLMEQNDLKEVPELSKDEERVIELIQSATNQFTDQLAATVEEIDNIPFSRLDNYILPIKYEKEFNIAGPDMINQSRHRTTRTIQGFKFSRVKGVKRTPRIDVFGVFEEAIADQQWYLNLQPRLEHARQLVLTEEYAEASGDLVANWWGEQLDQIARRGWSSTAKSNPLLRQVRLNLNQAILGYKLSSIVMQPFAVFDAMAYVTAKYGLTTSQDIIKEFTKTWVNPKYAESIIQDSLALPNRRAGEIAVEEVLDKLGEAKTLRQKFIKGGLSLLQAADVKTAAGVRQGLLKVLEKRGVENAKDEADFLMNMVSGSSEVTLRPQVLGQGELQRTYFTFQSFMLNRWGIIANDIIANGLIKKGTWKNKFNAMLAIAIFMAAGATEDEARELVFELTTGKELPDENVVIAAMLSLISNIPVFGNMIESTIKGRSTTPPAIRTVESAIGGAKALVTGKSPETRLRGALRASEAALAITAGIPGTAQAFDVAERIMIPPRKRD